MQALAAARRGGGGWMVGGRLTLAGGGGEKDMAAAVSGPGAGPGARDMTERRDRDQWLITAAV